MKFFHDSTNSAPVRGFAILTAVLFFAFGAGAQMTNALSDAEIQGRRLARQICERLEQPPAENQTNSGLLIIDGGHGRRMKTPVQFRTTISAGSWSTMFETTSDSHRTALAVIHQAGEPDQCELFKGLQKTPERLSGNETMIPFAGSDFWAADLALQFFYWPDQRIFKEYEMRSGRACHVLESINPNPTNGYSRVLSWIDNETFGIVQAKAYDAKGKLLKEFYPKDFKKVNGQWEVGEMEMINDQTGSRSWIKFDLNRRH